LAKAGLLLGEDGTLLGVADNKEIGLLPDSDIIPGAAGYYNLEGKPLVFVAGADFILDEARVYSIKAQSYVPPLGKTHFYPTGSGEYFTRQGRPGFLIGSSSFIKDEAGTVFWIEDGSVFSPLGDSGLYS